VGLVAGGALLLSTKGIFAKLLYAEGVGVIDLVAIRTAFALPVFWAWGVWNMGLRPLLAIDRSAMLACIGVGFLCYYIAAVVDFYALSLIDAGLERVLLFSYPTLVVIAHALLTRRWPGVRILLALSSTYLGIILVVGLFDADLWAANRYGAALVLFCACTLAIYFLVNERAGRKVGSIAFTVYGMSSAAVGLAAHWLLTQDPTLLADYSVKVWGMLAFLGIVITALALFMIAEGVQLIGAQRGAIISTVGPPSTILLAGLVLGESMAPLQLTGVAFIMGGILVLELRSTSKQPVPEPAS
jgi:drug/metabolite transporter (DMT)-like permease